MNTYSSSAQGVGARLSIGELAAATGLSVPVLRTWEDRHGFPRPERTVGGQRRYDGAVVAQVAQVQRLRTAGTRLDAAIAQVTQAPPPPGSAYAEVVRRHPEQPRQRLRKSTLLGLSWAIEDEMAAGAQRGHLFGAFQTAANFAAARGRWVELARASLSTHVLAAFDPGEQAPHRVDLVALPEDSPMRREWTVVCDAPGFPVALAAWELPGQRDVPDRDRTFESIWSVDPAAVRTAARACASVAAASGNDAASALVAEDLRDDVATAADPLALSRLAHRMVAYVEQVATGRHRS